MPRGHRHRNASQYGLKGLFFNWRPIRAPRRAGVHSCAPGLDTTLPWERVMPEKNFTKKHATMRAFSIAKLPGSREFKI